MIVVMLLFTKKNRTLRLLIMDGSNQFPRIHVYRIRYIIRNTYSVQYRAGTYFFRACGFRSLQSRSYTQLQIERNESELIVNAIYCFPRCIRSTQITQLEVEKPCVKLLPPI